MGVDFEERRGAIETVFEGLGIPLHERNEFPDAFKALGWEWDLSPVDGPPWMLCAQDKFVFICDKLEEWSGMQRLRIAEFESLVGILRWLSAGFRVHVGRAHLGFLVIETTKHKRAELATRARWSGMPWMRTFTVGERAREALLFWTRFFPKWDGRCRVFLDFGPTATWEAIGRFDASTEWGCGGWLRY